MSIFHVETTSTTTPTTTVAQPIMTAYRSFDNTPIDVCSSYDGQIVNGASYSAAGSTNMPYVGYGRALFFECITDSLNLLFKHFLI